MDYNPPYFVKEKPKQNDEIIKEDDNKDNQKLKLTDDVIRKEIENK